MKASKKCGQPEDPNCYDAHIVGSPPNDAKLHSSGQYHQTKGTSKGLDPSVVQQLTAFRDGAVPSCLETLRILLRLDEA